MNKYLRISCLLTGLGLYLLSVGWVLTFAIPIVLLVGGEFISVHINRYRFLNGGYEESTLPFLDYHVDFGNEYFGKFYRDYLQVFTLYPGYTATYKLKEQIVSDNKKIYIPLLNSHNTDGHRYEIKLSDIVNNEFVDKDGDKVILSDDYIESQLNGFGYSLNNSYDSHLKSIDIHKSDILDRHITQSDINYDSLWLDSISQTYDEYVYKTIVFDLSNYIDIDNTDIRNGYSACRIRFYGVDESGYYPQFTSIDGNFIKFVIRLRRIHNFNRIHKFTFEYLTNTVNKVNINDVVIYSTKKPIYELVDRDLLDVYTEVLVDIAKFEETIANGVAESEYRRQIN